MTSRVPPRKTVLITGASGGIGKGIAEAAARDGWHLLLSARNAAAIEAFAADWRRRYGIEATAIAADLAAPGGAERLFAEVEARGVAIDMLVNNAGVGVYGEFVDTDLDDELAMLRLNIEAPTVLAKRFLPRLLARGGHILNISSIASFPPGPFLAVYYGSKAYLRVWSEGIAEELAARGVGVTAYCPGPTRTRFSEAANARRSALFKGGYLPDGDAVGADAWRVGLAGKRLAVHGMGNRLQVFLMRFTPRILLAKIVRFVSRPV
ncbi:SDR family NAD(P)-dependent oxidoreductase [Lysobacter pythonis]|uniref:SDR family NAD(P)-dependent oxidoreductase n=1 Tax=Solilutibacter pythonis TaxID=2483112 RepID=A0A3M2I2H7_9GAMM|nr:SDR family NAD(P)-dependent oxidoreductase [Lysobacter pythonis]RMH93402.1 SDR family NAD(P)-dependent oxidoreductase [Lysobacter pythonis]